MLTEDRFRNILLELIDENPFATRPVMKILGTRFTTEVKTLAVTLDEHPVLLVNLEFLAMHCKTDAHVKACIMHEFLHVLLGHTERFKRMSTLENIALDAVINAIIHRTMGADYSSFFSNYYESQDGIGRLLRPMKVVEKEMLDKARWEGDVDISGPEDNLVPPIMLAWEALYAGKLVADDILEIAKQMQAEATASALNEGRHLLGNHDGIGRALPDSLKEAVEGCMSQMNGHGIWRKPSERNIGPESAWVHIQGDNALLRSWKNEALAVLKQCLIPDRSAILRESVDWSYRVPVLSPKDRRAFLRHLWSDLIPETEWASKVNRPLGYANVYFDVSGSMTAEMPMLIELLGQLRRAIRMPFWAFSTEVCPATIVDGKLVTSTTGGTSMNCVLEHIARTKPRSSVVITDGYIEQVDTSCLASCRNTKIHAIVTRDGNAKMLEKAGIPYMQLRRLPNDSL